MTKKTTDIKEKNQLVADGWVLMGYTVQNTPTELIETYELKKSDEEKKVKGKKGSDAEL